MMRLKYVSSLVLLVAVAAIFWSQRSQKLLLSEKVVEIPAARVVDPAITKFRSEPAQKRVVTFLADETKRVGAIDPNPKATAERLDLVAQALDAEESSWLSKRALDAKEEGDARFLSVYLLARGNPDSSLQALKNIAETELPKKAPQAKLDLERQIRAMAIEGISAARGIPSARDELKEIAARQTDPFLQDRAQRGLYAWKTGKRVEEQDKQGLSELTSKQK